MFRDIHQLRDAPPFGLTAVEGLLSAEAMLHEALRFVPYCDEHRTVWSATFTRIILDAASQVDSLRKATATPPGEAGARMTITDHQARFGPLVGKQHVVFFGGATPRVISPFGGWQDGYTPQPWWDAYNALKHDRFSNQTRATLDQAVNAVAALFLAAIYSGGCDLALISALLLDPAHHNPWAYTATGLLRDVTFECRARLKTKLFAHPMGVFGVDDCNLSPDWPGGSPRFNTWWALNSERYTRPRE